MPVVSIIIPAYNAAKTINQTLKSLLSQSFTDFEIIIVNDGSTDSTPDVLQNYKDKIKIYSQINAGAPAARNAGAKQAAGQYLMFCDADIILKPTMLEKLYNALQNSPDKSYAYCGFKFGFKTFKLWPFSADKLKQMPYIHTTSLIKRADFTAFDQNLKRFQDWDLYLTLLEQGKTGVFVNEILFKVQPGGTMSAWLPKFLFKFPKIRAVKDYKRAESVIKQKHNL